MKKYLCVALLSLIPLDASAQEFLRWQKTTTYSWEDKNGSKQFSSQKPSGISNFKTIVTNFPVLTEKSNQWKFISVVGKDESQAAFSIKTKIKPGQSGKLVWYKFDYSNENRIVITEMFLAEINCPSNKIVDIQQQTFTKDGLTRMTQVTKNRFSVPDTTDDDLIKFACKK